MPKKKVASKLCIRCNRIMPLEKFSANKLWASQQYRDAWCTECSKQYCVDEETVKRYCFENNRKFKEKAWEAAKKKAQYDLANNKVWLNPMTSPEDKQREESLAVAKKRRSCRPDSRKPNCATAVFISTANRRDRISSGTTT